MTQGMINTSVKIIFFQNAILIQINRAAQSLEQRKKHCQIVSFSIDLLQKEKPKIKNVPNANYVKQLIVELIRLSKMLIRDRPFVFFFFPTQVC